MYRKTPTYKQYTYAQRVTQQLHSQAFPTNLMFSSYVDTRRHPIFCCKNISFLARVGVILDRLIWAYWVAFALDWSPAIFFLVGRSRFIVNPRHRSMDGERRSEIRPLLQGGGDCGHAWAHGEFPFGPTCMHICVCPVSISYIPLYRLGTFQWNLKIETTEYMIIGSRRRFSLHIPTETSDVICFIFVFNSVILSCLIIKYT